MTEFGKTPHISADRFSKLGYQLVIYPLSMMRMAMKAVEAGLNELKNKGTLQGVLDQMQTRSELYEQLKYTPGEQWDYPNSSR